MTTAMILTDIKRALFSGWSLLILIGATIAFNALFMQQARHPAPIYATRLAVEEAGRPATPTETMVRSVQDALQELGYYSGAVDGIAGPETAAAIRRFESAARLTVTGRADAALLDRLRHALTRRAPAHPHDSTGPAVPVAKAIPPDPMVAAVQKALSDAAYGPLTSDGVNGRRTVDAISRFQLDQGMAVTGTIDDALIARLIEVGAMDGGRR